MKSHLKVAQFTFKLPNTKTASKCQISVTENHFENTVEEKIRATGAPQPISFIGPTPINNIWRSSSEKFFGKTRASKKFKDKWLW